MISVLNHLLPLNGNKQVIYFFIPVFFVLFSCGASKTTTNTTTVVVPVVKPDVQDPIKDTVEIPPLVIKDPVKVDTIKEVIVKKDFKIAVMLPFGADNYDLNPYDIQQVDFNRASAMSIEFFQGFQLAINSVQTSEINADIYVFDTKNDENVVKRTFNTAPFPKVDLIVGPVYNKNLRVAADYAEKHKIPLISPLSSSSSITKRNKYYYTANGTTDAHHEAMMDHIQQFYPNDTLIIIHNSTSTEREVINSIKKINAKYDENPIFIKEIPLTVDDHLKTIKSQFDSLSTHLVFIPSNNEMFTTYVLSQLAQIKTYYPSIVFGMPNWNKFNNINYDYFEWLKVHLTESYWVNEHNIDVVNFEQSFQAYYHMKPSEYAYQGYDLANYVLAYIAKNRDKLNKDKERFFTIDELDQGLQTKFKFIPRKSESGQEIEYWDNSYIHIVKFENYRYNKVD